MSSDNQTAHWDTKWASSISVKPELLVRIYLPLTDIRFLCYSCGAAEAIALLLLPHHQTIIQNQLAGRASLNSYIHPLHYRFSNHNLGNRLIGNPPIVFPANSG